MKTKKEKIQFLQNKINFIKSDDSNKHTFVYRFYKMLNEKNKINLLNETDILNFIYKKFKDIFDDLNNEEYSLLYTNNEILRLIDKHFQDYYFEDITNEIITEI